MKLAKYWQRNYSYLLNELTNFNEIFRKYVLYDNTKSQKKPRFSPSLWKIHFREGGVSNWPPAVLGLKEKRNTSIYLKKLWNVIWSCNSFRKDCQNGLQHLRTTYETHRNRKKHTYIDNNSFYMRSKTKFTRNAISFRHNKNSV